MPEARATLKFLEDRWNAAIAAKLDQHELLRYRSNLLGSDLRITNFGGGNTSSKLDEIDPVTGDAVSVLWVKGSGGDLGSIEVNGFATLYLDRLLALEKQYRGVAEEDAMVALYPLVTFRTIQPRRRSTLRSMASSLSRMSIICIRTGESRWLPRRTASRRWTSSTRSLVTSLRGCLGSARDLSLA